MTSSADDTLVIGSDSFWEVGQYRRTVKRVDDGYALSKELIQMIKDRCDIETKYAHMLKKHSEEWRKKLDSGPVYGTLKSAWVGALSEADQEHDVHMEVKDRLIEQVTSHIKQWQKENYNKLTLPRGYQTKQAKESDDNFRRAQKPWAKLYEKVNKAKADYHKACRNERSAIHQEQNSRNDSGKSEDDKHKAKERVEKCRDEREKTKDRYEQVLNEINNYNSKYMDDMREVFETCQEMEKKRLEFFKEALFGVHSSLDLPENPKLKQIYANMNECIASADSRQDLKYWSDGHGVSMPMHWPQFEEYSEDLHSIVSGTAEQMTVMRKGAVATANTIKLTNINMRRYEDEFKDYNPDGNVLSKKEKRAVASSGGDGVMLTSVRSDKSQHAVVHSRSSTSSASAGSASSPPLTNGSGNEPSAFAQDDDWTDDAMLDDGREGTPVRALYDYDGAEDDELTFKQGDVFEKLEDEDEQGWCKGRLNGRVGLYPANYVQPV
ncbi:PREDICTED: protein kinase C and casein kinase substrate in neurons protein 1-like isoform X1 [Priapulus caudatus]|uniref:Protein kinase C and casein kinase substrate in neurons protein 1-like isoform X1 n=1 Tax=Priapulus caudatus TaxID=37621 RepID=A0ABM1E130_PRICU|nr:PREDICTED: protein kinase C and casein kinase substrate in neurons protein 1-like isoform X1 [Priapulus caudatus]XP_014665899.1 PREDICTED: protein kinase C and casein kinase substrate in neurons protein 1-like isoform X1 [Priapulus caudatus]XP_014665900.1 PREDICTED: protein kinase C and casein kinase substrate in neurons protein 1-like isoform X1 [Priapulus caudatus]XP_014665901.1 PREDICTED: protein kinase C and casein kinase substrate in neurons protein 1-like isoform X1 [Priapulus caudatus]